jgi:hypothetical protein
VFIDYCTNLFNVVQKSSSLQVIVGFTLLQFFGLLVELFLFTFQGLIQLPVDVLRFSHLWGDERVWVKHKFKGNFNRQIPEKSKCCARLCKL